MKTSRVLLASFLGLAAALGASAAPRAADPRMEVVFLEPKKFTDVKDSSMSDDVERTTYLDQLRDHLNLQARYFVPLGAKLQITITDIDMAGDFEPWRGPNFDSIRIVKDLYPPRINLAFRFVDAEGNVLKEGKRELRNNSFMTRITLASNNDTMRHEKELLDDWLRDEFPRVAKK